MLVWLCGCVAHHHHHHHHHHHLLPPLLPPECRSLRSVLRVRGAIRVIPAFLFPLARLAPAGATVGPLGLAHLRHVAIHNTPQPLVLSRAQSLHAAPAHQHLRPQLAHGLFREAVDALLLVDEILELLGVLVAEGIIRTDTTLDHSQKAE